jgi:recombination associated protein RdgC
MWFKNLQLYRFTKPFELDSETLGQRLAAHSFVPCGSQDTSRSGWTPPLGRHANEFVHATNGYLMVCCKRQDKLLPAVVVNEVLEEKLLKIEESEGRKLPAKQAYISPRDNLLVVNAASARRAEELVEDLRTALGSLPVVPLASKNQPIDVMTRWLASARPAPGFTLGEECELRDNADISCVIRCKNQDLTTNEIGGHLKTSMHVSKLALNWQDRIEFLLDEKLIVKRLRFSDLVQDQASEIETDDVAARFDVDFSIMALELSGFFKALLEALGGEDLASATGADVAA